MSCLLTRLAVLGGGEWRGGAILQDWSILPPSTSGGLGKANQRVDGAKFVLLFFSICGSVQCREGAVKLKNQILFSIEYKAHISGSEQNKYSNSFMALTQWGGFNIQF